MWRTVDYYEDGRPKIDVNEQGAVYSYATKQLLTGDGIYRYIAKAFPDICGEWFEGCHVHHKDFNHFNNAPSNLICLTPEEHRQIHGKSAETIQHIIENYNLKEGDYKVYCRKS